MQIGIVVRDLDATMRKYVDEYGIGPWRIYESIAKDLQRRAQPRTEAERDLGYVHIERGNSGPASH